MINVLSGNARNVEISLILTGLIVVVAVLFTVLTAVQEWTVIQMDSKKLITVEFDTPEDYNEFCRKLDTYDELEEKHWDECRQIAHYEQENRRIQEVQSAIDLVQENLDRIKAKQERRRKGVICIFFGAAALIGYVIGYFTGRRCAQQDIKELRLELGLDAETGEK